jgi:hypothetical protein
VEVGNRAHERAALDQAGSTTKVHSPTTSICSVIDKLACIERSSATDNRNSTATARCVVHEMTFVERKDAPSDGKRTAVGPSVVDEVACIERKHIAPLDVNRTAAAWRSIINELTSIERGIHGVTSKGTQDNSTTVLGGRCILDEVASIKRSATALDVNRTGSGRCIVKETASIERNVAATFDENCPFDWRSVIDELARIERGIPVADANSAARAGQALQEMRTAEQQCECSCKRKHSATQLTFFIVTFLTIKDTLMFAEPTWKKLPLSFASKVAPCPSIVTTVPSVCR